LELIVKLNPLCLARYEVDYEVDFSKTLFQSTINFNYVENGKLEQMHYKLQISMKFKKCVFAKFIYNLQVWNMEPMNFFMEKLKNKSSKEKMKKSLMGINE